MPTEDDLEQMLSSRESPFSKEERALIRQALAKDEGINRVRRLAEELNGIEPEDEILGLYRAYCKELSQYDDTEYPEGQDERVYNEYRTNPDVTTVAITNGQMKIGFLMLAKTAKAGECIICEAYVLPAFRNQGRMKQVLEKALKPYNSIRFVVFNDNPAKAFWEKVLQELGRIKIGSAPYERQFTEYLYW